MIFYICFIRVVYIYFSHRRGTVGHSFVFQEKEAAPA